MFTGIIEVLGRVTSIKKDGTSAHYSVRSSIGSELKVDQSVSHNGVCLTVTKLEGDVHFVTAVEETLQKSNLGKLKEGDPVNLERSMLNNGRVEGHLVQGHIDQTGTCTCIKDQNE